MGRSPCCEKKNGLKKGPWTPEEDQKLIDYINKHGYGNWRTLPKNAGLQRCGKSCRLRWTNYLRPDIKRGRFSFEEEETIIHLHSIMGNKWSAIAARLPGRTDNEIKNYWNTHIRKRLLKMGIDPVTHTPRLDLLDVSYILNPSLYTTSQYHHQNQHHHTKTHENHAITKIEINQYQTSYNMIGTQELKSCFPIMDQFKEFQDLMTTKTFQDPMSFSDHDHDYLRFNFVSEPFYDFSSVFTTPSDLHHQL